MQIFLPYANPIKTAKCLDNKRLNKQIIECIQIISANTGINIGWKIPKYCINHPITKLWKENIDYLIFYCKILLVEFEFRKKIMHKSYTQWIILFECLNRILYTKFPKHITSEFCKFHQRKLYNKNPEYYKQFKEGIKWNKTLLKTN